MVFKDFDVRQNHLWLLRLAFTLFFYLQPMKNFAVTFLIIVFHTAAVGQSSSDTVAYFDKYWTQVKRRDASFYRMVEPAGQAYHVRDYYMSGQLQMEAICTAYLPKLKWDGNAVLYHENGVKQEEGPFKDESRYGVHHYWYRDGSKKKVVEFGKDVEIYREYLSHDGVPLITDGNGIVEDSINGRAVKMEIESALVVLSFEVIGNDSIYIRLKDRPVYHGGDEGLIKKIRSNLIYPRIARKQGAEGRVFVGFVVDKNGMVQDISVLKGISPECDAEASRVARLLTDWRPGTVRGKPVSSRMVLPINFKLK